MFQGVEQRFRWLTPPLPVPYVAQRIINIMESNQSQIVKMPAYAHFLPLLKLLPISISDWINEYSGANHDMEKFSHSVSALKVKK